MVHGVRRKSPNQAGYDLQKHFWFAMPLGIKSVGNHAARYRVPRVIGAAHGNHGNPGETSAHYREELKA